MTGFESPIEIAVNTNRLFMEGLHGVLDLQFRNRSGEDQFSVEAHLSGRLLGSSVKRKLTLDSGAIRKRTVDLQLPRGEASGIGSAGDARFDVELIVDAGEEGRHRFSGEFTLAVLAYAENRHDINVNISKLIEQTGEKAGMGAINEIDLSNFIKLPGSVTVNELITQKRPPRFVPIELEYEGQVEEAPPPIVHRDVETLSRCSIVDEETGSRLLILTGDLIVLGKNRQKADIVTWKMPRSEENDLETRKISGQQCRLNRMDDGLTIEQQSSVNPTKIDGRSISSRLQLETDTTTDLLLPAAFTLRLTPLPMPHVSVQTLDGWKDAAGPVLRHLCDWSQRTGIGGLLIERTDELASSERYLWLFSIVAIPTFDEAGEHRKPNTDVGVLAMPKLHVGSLIEQTPLTLTGQVVRSGSAWPLAIGDQIESATTRMRLCEWEQQLDA